MAMPWGAIISAGASLAGKLFGSDPEPQNPFPRGDQLDRHMKNIVHAAEVSGFNPLTVLGSSAAGVTTGMAGPALSSSSAVSDVFGEVANFFASYDPQSEKRAQAEYDLVQAQLQNLQADTAVRLRSLETPVSSGGRVVDASGRPVGNAGGKMSANGMTWNVNPNNTPSQVMEDQYGGASDLLAGANMAQDILTSQTGVSTPYEAGKAIRERAASALRDWWDSDPQPVQNPALPMGWSPQQLFNSTPW